MKIKSFLSKWVFTKTFLKECLIILVTALCWSGIILFLKNVFPLFYYLTDESKILLILVGYFTALIINKK